MRGKSGLAHRLQLLPQRHCPKCQGPARTRWLAARESELLPVPYFHVVFTVPRTRRRHRIPEQGGRLHHPVEGGRRGPDCSTRCLPAFMDGALNCHLR
ncbi:transposase zinc-binding domain-containing protein [Mesorhizobium sp. BAC0120]|uniref:transposase zinc-binding domain-containing protein n=1 Tax=Mesorhizobium sp. BAC0120 TaxID=3090670 RepID=UPI00399A60C6